MKCPACEKPIEQGKVLLCVACFTRLPNSERVALRKHYIRVLSIAKGNKAILANGMGPKIARAVRMLREDDRPLGPSESEPVAIVRLSAESLS